MRLWTWLAALGAISLMGCATRETPPPQMPGAVVQDSELHQKVRPAKELLRETRRRWRRRPRQRLAHR